jgi:hypothetical protein
VVDVPAGGRPGQRGMHGLDDGHVALLAAVGDLEVGEVLARKCGGACGWGRRTVRA